MPRPRKGPHLYRRPGRWGLYAYVTRDRKDIALGTDDEAEGLVRLAKLLDDRGLRPASQGRKSLVELAEEHRLRSETNHAKNTTIKEGANASRVLKWLATQGIQTADLITRDV